MFNEPKIALNRMYTKRGDAGETSLVGGQRVPKDTLRIECYGTVDELNSIIGLVCVSASESKQLLKLAAILSRVQHELFNLGSILATKAEDIHPNQPRVTVAEVLQLEHDLDAMNDDLPPLRSFVLPGGCRINAEFHLARTVCRRAERIAVALAREEPIPAEIVQYLNRLSDALFVWSRSASRRLGATEVLWETNKAASAATSPWHPL